MTRSRKTPLAAVPALALSLLMSSAPAAGAQEYGDEWSPEAQQPGDEWSGDAQQPGDEWSGEQRYGDEWSGEQRHDDAWYGQPSPGGRHGLLGLL